MTTYSPEPQLLDAGLEAGCPASCDLGDLNRTGPRGPGHGLLPPGCFLQSLLPSRFYPTLSCPKLLPGRELFGFFLPQLGVGAVTVAALGLRGTWSPGGRRLGSLAGGLEWPRGLRRPQSSCTI